MRFTPALLTLAATASAAVLPRSQLGSWDVSVSKSAYANGFKSETVSAVYTSDSYPEGVSKKCEYTYNPAAEGEKESSSCDEGFGYEYDGTTISLNQVVQEPSPDTTVFGSAELTLKSDAVGRTFTGEVTVEVTSATA